MRALARLALLAAAALGAVAYLRVRAERASADVPTAQPGGAPGLLPHGPRPAAARAGPPAGSLGPSWEPRVLTRLASWRPAPPGTPAHRLLAYAWAAPMTAAGLLLAATTGVRPVVQEGALVFEEARGPVAAYLRSRRFSASTLGHVIIAVGTPSASLLVHELVHVRQAERLGIFLAPCYLALLAVYGYRENPLERAARAAQRAFENGG